MTKRTNTKRRVSLTPDHQDAFIQAVVALRPAPPQEVTLASTLLDHLDMFEQAIARGVTVEQIVTTLRTTTAHEVSVQTLRSYLRRARERRREARSAPELQALAMPEWETSDAKGILQPQDGADTPVSPLNRESLNGDINTGHTGAAC